MLGDVIGDLFHEPFKALAVALLTEFLQLTDVPVSQSFCLRPAGIEKVFVLVPPDLHHTDVILPGRWGRGGGLRMMHIVQSFRSTKYVCFPMAIQIFIKHFIIFIYFLV